MYCTQPCRPDDHLVMCFVTTEHKIFVISGTVLEETSQWRKNCWKYRSKEAGVSTGVSTNFHGKVTESSRNTSALRAQNLLGKGMLESAMVGRSLRHPFYLNIMITQKVTVVKKQGAQVTVATVRTTTQQKQHNKTTQQNKTTKQHNKTTHDKNNNKTSTTQQK